MEQQGTRIDVAEFDLGFATLSGGLEQQELVALLERLHPIEVAAGEVLITEGTPTGALYLVWDGRLQVSVLAGEGDVEIGVVDRGGYVGEVSLFDPGEASATVRSEEGATVLALDQEDLESFTSEYPHAAAALVRELGNALAQRIRLTARQLARALEEDAAPVLLPDRQRLTPAEIGQLAELGERHSFADGAVLGAAGTRAEGVHVLLDGTVVRRLSAGGDARDLCRLQAGSLLGAETLLHTVLATDLVADGPAVTSLLSTRVTDELGRAEPGSHLALDRAVCGQLAGELRALAEAHRARTVAAATPTTTADVAVIGGGFVGLAYAWFLKDARPRTSVTVVDRRAHPGYKVGESTLGTTTRCMLHMGLDLPVLRRLLGIKSGIRFWWTGEGDTELQRHIDAVDIDETFQVERRVIETALQETTRRRGVDIRTGTRVDVGASTIGSHGVQLRCRADGVPYELDAAAVCDASGPAALLPRRFGMYRRDPQRLATFNTSAYYAYFRQREDVPFAHWDEPATRHICFPQGWCWFITVISWEGTPQENLEAMVRFLLDHPPGPDESYPTRRELEERFGCTSEPILSVGFTVRDDLDTSLGRSLEGRFRHYLERYPAIGRILDHYDLVEAPYGKPQPYLGFQRIAHDAATVSGDRWCAVGDAAMFSNPLFSPGLNFGTGTAYEAARDTARGLDAGDLSRATFRAYGHYAERTYEVLMAFNDMLYRSFRHHETFERALAMFFFHSAADVLEREAYSETDPYVWDLLNPEFRRRVDEVRRVLRAAEERGAEEDTMIAEVRAITDSYIAEVTARPEIAELDLPSVLREFGPDGQRAEQRDTRPGALATLRCDTCRQWYNADIERCPVCGTTTPVAAETPAGPSGP